MPTEQTTVTTKYQATIPKHARRVLGIRPGQKVQWNIVRERVIVDSYKPVQDPVKFLTSQLKGSTLDAVKLVREFREEL